MKFIALVAGLCLLTTLSAGAQERLILGDFDPNATEATVRATLESIAAVDNVYRINPLGDGRGVSVFRATYGKEGARIETLRRMAETGMVGYPLDSPDDCTLSVYNRKDQTAVKALDTNPYLRTLQEAEEELDAAEAALAEIEVVILDIKENFEEGKGQLEMRIRMLTAAREATTRARAVYQGAYDKMRATPSRENFLALLRATVDVQLAARAEATAAAAQREAEVQVANLQQELDQAEATKRGRATKVYEKQTDKDIASRALDAAWDVVGESIKQDIVSAAEALARDALDVADALNAQAEFLVFVRSVLSGHSGGWSFWGDDNGEIPFDHLLADIDASNALALVEAARKLPPVTKEVLADASQRAALEDAQWELEQGRSRFAVNSMALASEMRVGTTPWHLKVLRALVLAEAQCTTQNCDDDVAELGNELESLQQLSLQQAMQQQSQVFNTLTNVQKSKHDMQMAVIQNIR